MTGPTLDEAKKRARILVKSTRGYADLDSQARHLAPLFDLPPLALLDAVLAKNKEADALFVYHLLDLQRNHIRRPKARSPATDRFLVRLFDASWSKVTDRFNGLAIEAQPRVAAGNILRADVGGTDPRPQVNEELALERLQGYVRFPLAAVNWSNVVLAGGMALRCLSGYPQRFDQGDVDFFIFGLSVAETVLKIAELVQAVTGGGAVSPVLVVELLNNPFRSANVNGAKVTISPQGNVVTILVPDPTHPVVQIVAFDTASAYDVLDAFDLDACAVAFNGEAFVATARALRSLSLGGWSGGVNFLDLDAMAAQDPTARRTALRAKKYNDRGFALAMTPSDTAFALRSGVCPCCVVREAALDINPAETRMMGITVFARLYDLDQAPTEPVVPMETEQYYHDKFPREHSFPHTTNIVRFLDGLRLAT